MKITNEHVFSGGVQESATGIVINYTEKLLQEIVDSYNRIDYRAPVVWGHSSDQRKYPEDAVPAAGWILSLARKGIKIIARIEWSSLGQRTIEERLYRNFSAAFYSPQSRFNPAGDEWTLRHVALLGTEPPAVKILEEISFSSGEEKGVDYIYMEGNMERTLRYNKFYNKPPEENLHYDAESGLYYEKDDKGEKMFTYSYVGKDGEDYLYDKEKGYEKLEMKEFFKEQNSNKFMYKDGNNEKHEVLKFSTGDKVYSYSEKDKKYYNEETKDPLDEEPDEISLVEEYKSSEPEESSLEFTEALGFVQERLEKIEKENERLRKIASKAQKELNYKETRDYVNKIYEDGKLTDGIMDRDKLINYMENIKNGNYVEFSEKKISPIDTLKELLDNLPLVVNYEDTQEKHGDDIEFKESGLNDPHSQAMKMVERGDFSDYTTAIKHVLYGSVE